MTNAPEAVHSQATGEASQTTPKTTGGQPSGESEPARKSDGPMKRFGKPLAWAIVVLALAAGGYYAWLKLQPPGLPAGIASGNGRIEATEIDVDAKIAGRIADILVAEGDFVTAGQVLVHMDTRTLEAQRHEAEAQLERATIGIDTAQAVVKEREAEQVAAKANIGVTQAVLDAALARLARVEPMAKENIETKQALDDARAAFSGATAGVAGAQAKVAAAEAAISAAKAGVVDAK